MFRVSACNDFGISEAQETDRAYKIAPQYGKYSILATSYLYSYLSSV